MFTSFVGVMVTPQKNRENKLSPFGFYIVKLVFGLCMYIYICICIDLYMYIYMHYLFRFF
jgi:hypothetical protein